MKCFNTPSDWRLFKKTLKNESVGFVPTMGNLHEGHLSLIRESQKKHQKTLVSIFVNPTQFNCENDFRLYPRTVTEDIALLEQAQVDFCLIPDVAHIYPDNKNYRIEETENNALMEGLKRPGHISGMLTVVMKLLQIADADTAFFGEKDYQQYLLVKGMVEAFFIPTDITLCQTIRDPDGLAKSSRNSRLSKEERATAQKFAEIFHDKHLSNEDVSNKLQSLGIHVDYIETHEHRRFGAVFIGKTRLIDNVSLI